MRDFNEQLAEIATLRRECAECEERLYRARLRRQKAGANAAEGTRELEAATEARADCEKRLGAAIGELHVDTHPRTLLAQLDDRVPFLLFPVRLETIFVPARHDTGLTTPELWVRVYPDEISVHRFEKTLTDREITAGELYWTELVSAEHLRAERDNRRRSCFRHLVELFGGPRAGFIARQTKPSDFDALAAAGTATTLPDFLRTLDTEFFARLSAEDLAPDVRTRLDWALTQDDGDAFSLLVAEKGWGDRVNETVRSAINGFPPHDLTKTDAWSRAPRTNTLPERFVLLLYADEISPPRQVTGNLVPDTVYLGPDPLDADAGFTKQDDVLGFGASFAWMQHFDDAVEKGLAFRVPLGDAEARAGFARVLVLGVKVSTSAGDAAAALEALIDNHHFSPKGFSLVPQGTATNNTESNGSGYSDDEAYDAGAFFSAIDPPAFDPQSPDPKRSRTDGRLLADALGISYETLESVQHADQTDVLEGLAMGTALFPSTWGYWLRSSMAPLVSAETAVRVRDFFTQFVSGRGPLPAVRVGNQPYGVLVTSDATRWAYPSPESGIGRLGVFQDRIAFLRKLSELLTQLEAIWDESVKGLPHVGRPGSDPSDVLMKVLGLQPTSVEFFQRIGYSHEYLKNLVSFTDGGRYANELRAHMQGLPPTARLYLQTLGLSTDLATVGALGSLGVLWQHFTNALASPNLVDDRPPSETDALAPDYIAWLAQASNTQAIIDQSFTGEPPTSLLYSLLRNALLLQLHHGAYEWLKERSVFEPALEAAVRPTTLASMRPASPTLSKFELLTARVDLAEPAHPVPGTSVADWIWKGPPPEEIEAAFLREQKTALQNLVNTPTARLERCLVEHLDCANYRLDAFRTGLFSERLRAQRDGAEQERRCGVYLGAFGWLENLRPTQKVFVAAEGLPSALRPKGGEPVLEEDDVTTVPGMPPGARQGGFVHAPSLNHAAAATLLRNAYLSHAAPEQAEPFAVNLSSERVRRGQFVLEGMRNGQPLEAVLGYQFERGLHDRTSDSAARGDVPVLELNHLILPFRQAFVFESREVPQGGNEAVETLPAYGVVNGLLLAQATLSVTNGFGLSGVLGAAELPNAAQGAALVAEQDALLDSLDAIKDLLMAENAFQLVRGNFERVAAVSLAQKDAHVPPELEVVQTPRGSEFTFTHRIALTFEDLDPNVPASNPWPAVPLTPRARAEAGMNAWLARVVGSDPARIVGEAAWLEGPDPGLPKHDPLRIDVAALGLSALDFVWLAGASPATGGGASELEIRIATHYRRVQGIPDERRVLVDLNPTLGAGEAPIAERIAIARHLRSLLSESRALRAGDFLPAPGSKSTGSSVPADNPHGYDLGDIQGRVQAAFDALSALADELDLPGSPAALRATLVGIASFGIDDAYPSEADLGVASVEQALRARAQRVTRRLRGETSPDGALDRASALLANVTVGKTIADNVGLLLSAGRIVFGETFDLLPKFVCHNASDLALSNADRPMLLKHATDSAPDLTSEGVVEEWLQGLARVRPRLARWEIVRTLADGLSDVALPLWPVQVPYRAKDSWLAVAFPALDSSGKKFGISRDTLSIAAHGAGAFTPGTRKSGVLIDDFTEEIPTDEEITGIGFRYNQPNAVPPQTLLLAVTPVETGAWSWDDLVGTLLDTLRRAKRRAVEPEHLEKQGTAWNAFAPALVSEFSAVRDADVSLDLLGMLELPDLNAVLTRVTTP